VSAARAWIVAIHVTAVVAGAMMYYLQVYAFYRTLTPEEAGPIALTPPDGAPEPLAVADLRAIDSDSSPIRYRACFETAEPLATLAARYEPYPDPRPLTAPGWFDCFDAPAIGAALEAGEARAFLGVRDHSYGIDRVVAVLPDGRGFAWPQINPCGERVFNGEPPPEGCPPVPEGTD
jgi:hypothetical protein